MLMLPDSATSYEGHSSGSCIPSAWDSRCGGGTPSISDSDPCSRVGSRRDTAFHRHGRRRGGMMAEGDRSPWGSLQGALPVLFNCAEDITVVDSGLWGGSLKQRWRRISGDDASYRIRREILVHVRLSMQGCTSDFEGGGCMGASAILLPPSREKTGRHLPPEPGTRRGKRIG